MTNLGQRGYRLTPQREMILSALHAAPGHATAQEIYTRVRRMSPRVNLATVYRTLQWLTELGLVSAIELGDGVIRYELSGPGHHHLICEGCGRAWQIQAKSLEPLRRRFRQERGFRVRVDHLALIGLCRDCTEKDARATRRGRPRLS